MASRGQEQDRHGIAAEKAMAGILALLVEQREQRVNGDTNATRIEVLLSRAGLSHEEIAAVTGKKANAVRVAIHRAKAK
jgi:DNA-directed RNA polymerase specialized sigma24 family protein